MFHCSEVRGNCSTFKIFYVFIEIGTQEKIYAYCDLLPHTKGFPGGSMLKIHLPSRRHRRLGFSPWGRSLEGGNGNPFWNSCLENPMGTRGSWTRVHRVTESQT